MASEKVNSAKEEVQTCSQFFPITQHRDNLIYILIEWVSNVSNDIFDDFTVLIVVWECNIKSDDIVCKILLVILTETYFFISVVLVPKPPNTIF